MSCSTCSQEVLHVDLHALDELGYRSSFVERSHVDELIALWESTLDVFSVAVPSKGELLSLVDNKQIICILDKNQHLVASLLFLPENKVCMLQHIVVNEHHRRRGLAKTLIQNSFSICNNINRYMLWVESNNIPAIHLYQNIGFEFDGMVSTQLVYK
jgi:ribosomal protein S18 acetylase RimI-like enzyme